MDVERRLKRQRIRDAYDYAKERDWRLLAKALLNTQQSPSQLRLALQISVNFEGDEKARKWLVKFIRTNREKLEVVPLSKLLETFHENPGINEILLAIDLVKREPIENSFVIKSAAEIIEDGLRSFDPVNAQTVTNLLSKRYMEAKEIGLEILEETLKRVLVKLNDRSPN